MQIREATNTHSTVFGLTRSRIEHTINHTRREHYTTGITLQGRSGVLITQTECI